MIARSLLVAAMLAGTAIPSAGAQERPAASAQDPAARARAVTAEVNGRLASLRVVKKTVRLPGNEFDTKATGWLDKGALRKALAVAADDSGEVADEYFLENGELVFHYRAIKGFEGTRQVTRVEHRFYFQGGKLARWLGGMEKAPQPTGDAEAKAEERRALEAVKALAAALR